MTAQTKAAPITRRIATVHSGDWFVTASFVIAKEAPQNTTSAERKSQCFRERGSSLDIKGALLSKTVSHDSMASPLEKKIILPILALGMPLAGIHFNLKGLALMGKRKHVAS